MAKIVKGKLIPNKTEKKVVSDEDIRRLLLVKTDEISTSKGSDESLDKFIERNKLIKSTKFPDLIGELQPYVMKFEKDFYLQIFKLRGWRCDSDKCLRRKPGIVAKITAYLIYLRFPQGVLKELQLLNQKNEDGIRIFKHFQWLTPEGEKQLKQFIKESTEMMKEYDSWNQFIKAFTLKYSNPYNLSWDTY